MLISANHPSPTKISWSICSFSCHVEFVDIFPSSKYQEFLSPVSSEAFSLCYVFLLLGGSHEHWGLVFLWWELIHSLSHILPFFKLLNVAFNQNLHCTWNHWTHPACRPTVSAFFLVYGVFPPTGFSIFLLFNLDVTFKLRMKKK